MVLRKLHISETFHSISKPRNSICDESRSLVFVSFLESRIIELFAVKSRIFKPQAGKVSASRRVSGFYHSPSLEVINPVLSNCIKRRLLSLRK